MIISDPGSGFFSIPDPGSESATLKKFNLCTVSVFNPKTCLLRCLSRIQVFFLSIPDPDPGSRGQKALDPESLIPDPDPQHCILPLGLHEGLPSYRRSLQPPKRTSSSSIPTLISSLFLFLRVIFVFLDPNPDLDPQTKLNPDLIRIWIRNTG